MAVYVGSALALLVTTSLLGLRRYLRQRKAKIPGRADGRLARARRGAHRAFLVVGAFLPRPHSEVPWFGIERAGKTDREASKYAMRKDGAGKGEGAPATRPRPATARPAARAARPAAAPRREGGGGKGTEGKGGSGKKSDQSGGDEKGGGKGQGNESEAKKDQEAEERGRRNTEQEQETQEDEGEGNDRNAVAVAVTTRREPREDRRRGEVDRLRGDRRPGGRVRGAGCPALPRPFTGWAQRLLDAIRNWWAGLWGGRKASPERAVERQRQLAGPRRPPPFHAYSNPFADGSAEARDPADLVAYTFDALDAWAWDRDAGRESPETPLEFLARLADLHRRK